MAVRVRKAERTKQALAMALEEMLQELPLSKVTVRALTERAGVDRQTFYYHFDTMNDLVVYLAQDRMSLLTKPMLSAALDEQHPREVFVRLIEQAGESRGVLVSLLESTAAGRPLLRSVFYEGVHQVISSYISAAVDEAGVFVPSKVVEETTLYCQFASVSIVIDWMCESGISDSHVEPYDLADMLYGQLEQQVAGLIFRARKNAG